MTVTTEANGQIVKAQDTSLAAVLLKHQDQIARALPRHLDSQRMTRIVMTALRTTPKLGQCDQISFLGCVLSLAQLGLEPNTPVGQAWLIPRSMNRKVGDQWTKRMECTVMLGYQGYVALAHRSGLVDGIDSRVVFKADAFRYQYGTDPRIDHMPDDGCDRTDPAQVTHAYAVGHMRHGRPIFDVLTTAQVEARRARSASGKRADSPWATDWIAMARKTAIRALWPQLPKSAEMAQASRLDEAHDLAKPITSAIDDGPAAEVLEQMGAELGDDGADGGE